MPLATSSFLLLEVWGRRLTLTALTHAQRVLVPKTAEVKLLPTAALEQVQP